MMRTFTQGVLALLDRIPLSALAPVAIVLALLPFAPRPHLVEKITMLWQGTLRRPIDIVDLLFHGLPLVVLCGKLIREALK